MSVLPDLKSLYEVDDSLWLEKTIDLLKEKKFDVLDLENLIEELADLADERKRRVANFLQQVIRYALLLQFSKGDREKNRGDWSAEMIHFQFELENYLTATLRKYLEQELTNIYSRAIRYLRCKTEDKIPFPDECPYTLENLLDPDWLPPYE